MVDHNLQHLMQLLQNKHIFASYQYIKTLPTNTPIPNKSKLIHDLKLKIAKARQLTSNINIKLDSGDYPKALHQLKEAQSLVADFPNIQTDIDFITASIVTLEKNLKEAQTLALKGKKQQVDVILQAAKNIDKNNVAIHGVKKSLRRSCRKKNAIRVSLASLALILPVLYFSFEHITLLQAKDLWSKADRFIGNKQYKQADAIITEMDKRLQYVRIFGQQDKVQLLFISANMTQSESFINGLQGRKTSPAQALGMKKNGNERHVEALLAKARVAEGKDLNDALDLYDKALTFSEDNIHISATTLVKIKSKQHNTKNAINREETKNNLNHFYSFKKKADSFSKTASWQQAVHQYRLALDYAKKNNLQHYSAIARVKRGYNYSFIQTKIENSEVALNQNRYTDAIKSYQDCLDFIKKNNVDNQQLCATIRAQILAVQQKHLMVGLAHTIELGDQFSMGNDYELSTLKYEAAIALLDSSNLQLQGDKDQTIRVRINQKIELVKQKSIVVDQKDHLMTSYQKILRSNFNLSRNTVFKNPEIVFIANRGDHLIYKVSAFGSKSKASSHVKYELDYKFNVKTGNWNINDIPLGV